MVIASYYFRVRKRHQQQFTIKSLPFMAPIIMTIKRTIGGGQKYHHWNTNTGAAATTTTTASNGTITSTPTRSRRQYYPTEEYYKIGCQSQCYCQLCSYNNINYNTNKPHAYQRSNSQSFVYQSRRRFRQKQNKRFFSITSFIMNQNQRIGSKLTSLLILVIILCCCFYNTTFQRIHERRRQLLLVHHVSTIIPTIGMQKHWYLPNFRILFSQRKQTIKVYPKSVTLSEMKQSNTITSSSSSSSSSPASLSTVAIVLKRKLLTNTRHGRWIPWIQNSTIGGPDFGGLDIINSLRRSTTVYNDSSSSFQQHTEAIIINSIHDYNLYEIQRNATLTQWDIDDGISHTKYYPWEDIDFENIDCQRPKWTYDIHPVCNVFHEVSTLDRPIVSNNGIEHNYQYTYLAHGWYRDSFLFEPLVGNTINSTDSITSPATTTITTRNDGVPYYDEFVMKSLRYQHNPDRDNFILIHAEAITMDVLTSSPRIANIYTFCGDSILLERGYEIEPKILANVTGYKQIGFMSQNELDTLEVDDVHPMNNLTNEEKLTMAIEITEGIAEQHGYYKGVMMNDDIEIKQWLQRSSSTDKSLFLNDVGNTLFRSWDGIDYCQSWVQYGGDFKSPEEFNGTYVDESSDIWPIGNILYTLLTGLHPYHNITSCEQSEIWDATQKYVPYIDIRYKTSRSYIERRLVEIMELCHQHDPKKRVTIFQIVQHLYETKKQYNLQKQKNQRIVVSGQFQKLQKRNNNNTSTSTTKNNKQR